MSTPEETRKAFVKYIKEDLYCNALALANIPGITDDLLRETIVDLLAIANNLDAEPKARQYAVYVARSFFWQRESFKNDEKLSNDLLRVSSIVEPDF
jgi:hypothetical protein